MATNRLESRNPFLDLVMRQLRQYRPAGDSEEFGYFIEQTEFQGKAYELPLAWFVTNGCSWARAGCCSMCNYGVGSGITSERIIWQVEQILERIRGLPLIYITPLGSMFDESEVPPGARRTIFTKIAESGCRIFGTESRPETITDLKIAEFRKIFGEKIELQIGLGLESSNPLIRRNCINKGLETSDFLAAMEVMRKYGVKSMVHILLKPPFLTEDEAIRDAIQSIKWAFDNGADRIILLMTNLKPYTLTDWLADRGRYRVPYVWSGIKVVRSLPKQHQRSFTLSGLYSGVPIAQTAYNCADCTGPLIAGLQEYSNSLDSRILDDLYSYSCECKLDYENLLSLASAPLQIRIRDEYEFIARSIYGDLWWNEAKDWVERDLQYSFDLLGQQGVIHPST